MLDYRDIVDYVLLVFQKKTLDPISEEESIEISEIVQKIANSKIKDYKSLTNKALFKFMDLIDM